MTSFDMRALAATPLPSSRGSVTFNLSTNKTKGNPSEVDDTRGPQDAQRSTIRPLAIKVNNFLLWGASGCVVPYLSPYFKHYTQASESDVGQFGLLSAFVGTLATILLGGLADRWQAHRWVYLGSLLLTYLSFCFLLVPIFLTDQSEIAPGPKDLQQNRTMTEDFVTYETLDVKQPIWFYLVGACIALGSLGTVTNMNFSESFSANAAKRCSNASYGTLRFYGSIAYCLVSLGMSLINEIEQDLPYFSAAWVMFALFGGANIVVVLCWPDKQPFLLADASPAHQDLEEHLELSGTRLGSNLEVLSLPLHPKLTKLKRFGFDTLEPDGGAAGYKSPPEVRRCSIAALGNSHVIELFKVDESNPHKTKEKARCSGKEKLGESQQQHFKYITRIEPSRIAAGKLPRENFETTLSPPQAAASTPQNKRPKSMSLRLHLKIIELIARRKKNVIRFMGLYALFGFLISMNWYYFVTYLELLAPEKFKTLSPYVMAASYLSETLFYYVSANLTSKLRHSYALSLVFLVIALRYFAYLTFTLWPGTWWPIEIIILVEMLQSLTASWFDCIFNEASVEFALEAEHCVDQLLELGLIEDSSPDSIAWIRDSVKMSILSISSCFLDGIGVGLGALSGGWVIEHYGYKTLWLSTASFSLLVSVGNIMLE